MGAVPIKNCCANFCFLRNTGPWWIFGCVQNWVQQGNSTSCVFFNGWVFYHPGGDFYTMVLQNTKKYNKNKKANRRPDKLTKPTTHHHSGSE